MAPAPQRADGLTIPVGETWVFTIADGRPANARKAAASAKPSRGEVVVSVRAMMGTSLTIVSNNPVAYTYSATLLGVPGGKAPAARSCTLPANNRLSFESWPQRSTGVRLAAFKPATADGSCP